MNILFNSSGIPLLMQSTYIFGETTGTPRNEMKERTRILAPYDLSNVSYIDIDGVKVRPWGDENDFPQKAAEEIGNTSVLNTGLKFLRNLTLGQGIYPCTVNGYDNDGNEILKPVTDSRVQTFIASRNVRRYMEKVLRDYSKFGNGAVQFVPSAAGNSLQGSIRSMRFTAVIPKWTNTVPASASFPDIGRNVRTRDNTPGWMCSPNTTRRCTLKC